MGGMQTTVGATYAPIRTDDPPGITEIRERLPRLFARVAVKLRHPGESFHRLL
jgi:hypothetical protein